jgi:hypothetical protein
MIGLARLALICVKDQASPAGLKSRNDEQTATDRNQVFEQSNVEIWLAQRPYEPNAGLIAAETTNDSADQSQPSTNQSRLSTAKRNACAREATGHDAGDKSERSSAVRSIRQLINNEFCDGQQAQKLLQQEASR